jgi:hypothetical protein
MVECEKNKVSVSCELERTETVRMSLKSDKEIHLSQYHYPSVRICHSRKGDGKTREYELEYMSGNLANLDLKVKIDGKEIRVDYRTYAPDWNRECYDPFNEGVSLSAVVYAPDIERREGKVTVRPNNLGSFRNIYADVDLVNLFVISTKGILFNNSTFVQFAGDGSLMKPVTLNKSLKRS